MNIRLLLLAALLLTGCATVSYDTVTQISTIDALLAGAYEGQMELSELLTYGDFGLGTFDALDGELIALDGEIFQARADGTVHRPPPDETTPFATVAYFRPNHIRGLPRPLDYPALLARIDQVAPERNLFLAVRIDGVFSYVKVRAAPAQQKPYPPLTEVAETQPVFEYTNARGTVVGFRCPSLVKGLNVPGYHLHFISDDRSVGGHVLDLRLSGGVLTLDRCNRFHMILPEDGRVLEQIDLTRDRSGELERVEK